MDALSSQQNSLGKEIEKLIVNFKKSALERRTTDFLQRTLERLEELWEQFNAGDASIRQLGPASDLPYINTNYYGQVKLIYEDYKAQLTDKLQASQQIIDKPLTQFKLTTAGALSEQPANVVENKHLLQQTILLKSLQRSLSAIEAETSPTRDFCEVKIAMLQRYEIQLRELEEKFWATATERQLASHCSDIYYSTEQQVQAAIIRLKQALRQSYNQDTTTQVVCEARPKLPEIIIPKFDGDYLKWPQFHDLFKQMIHNQAISNCQKLWYLKNNLLGEAERLIRHFTISDANYEAAWTLLQERYNNKRLLTSAFLNRLLSQPTYAVETAASLKTLHDTTKECLLGLENIGVSASEWDPILVHLLLRKVDGSTRSLYEQALKNPRELQPLEEFLTFIASRFQALESIQNKSRPVSQQRHALTAYSATPKGHCHICQGQHRTSACIKLHQASPDTRLNMVKHHKLCCNCLSSKHRINTCGSGRCKKCSKKHNTLLHDCFHTTPLPKALPAPNNITTAAETCLSTLQTEANQDVAAHATDKPECHVLLATALVHILGPNGEATPCRALLDSGSQVNLISESLTTRLGLKRLNKKVNICGVGTKKVTTSHKAKLFIQSPITGYKMSMNAIIMDRITSQQPTWPLDSTKWPIPGNIRMADPRFNQPAQIDLLIGAEFYLELLSVGQIKLGKNLPVLQKTLLGWIVTGKVEATEGLDQEPACAVHTEDQLLNDQLSKFWDLEKIENEQRPLTAAERRCENHFLQTTVRDNAGRFVVRLPFTSKATELGDSFDTAFKRFTSLERKLNKSPNLKAQYVAFMNEYFQLGHMKEINIQQLPRPHYFIPHHAVLKPSSTTTKLRVVFDASCKTTSNISLNDILAAGPTIQSELFSVLLRFRLPKFVFIADIEKMYRQIWVHDDDQQFQLILWRSDPSENIRAFQLQTVTYGMTSASFQAIRCLESLGEEGVRLSPLGSKAIKRNFYVDNVMAGSDTIAETIDIQKQLKELLNTACFKLRKWSGNHPQLIQGLPLEDIEVPLDFDNNGDQQCNALGLTWSPKLDSFCVRASWSDTSTVTKRSVCSDTARLFDPLGIMSPVVVIAKMFIQQLWKEGFDWDESLPQHLHNQWLSFRERLRTFNDVKIPRHVIASHARHIQIHAFSNASEKAYGAVVYIRSIDQQGLVRVRILCAKSRIAPLKQITLPRLELCAAKIAADLVARVKSDLDMQKIASYFWTDSETVLAWLNASSSSLHTFVANRVAAIQAHTLAQQWRHVSTKQNPADFISRGLNPEKIKECNLWFYGPVFLHGKESSWPPPLAPKEDLVLEKRANVVSTTSEPAQPRIFDTIRHELKKASTMIVKCMQKEHFSKELKDLARYNEVAKDSQLSTLAPFIDANGVIRVGGRLEAAEIAYDRKHPILLPYSDPIATQLMTAIHVENLHVGPQTLLSIIRQRYWPIKGKSTARAIVQRCIRCTRAKPKLLTQMMGNLPLPRIMPSRPFNNAGIDFCGPIWTHYKVRGKKPQKTYVAVFCCFATKAVHLELVTDLTTAAFIGALRRFMGRRGQCSNIYCDNATNFVGASNQLRELHQTIHSRQAQDQIVSACRPRGIEFHFIPPRAPHFGGLWEAAVKSAKHLLQRSISAASLTYEELETLMIEIEAVLNSRPITPLSSNPNDLSALTPGHFLIGEPLNSPPDDSNETARPGLLNRWKLVTYIKNEFWKRWSREYLNELQQRYKWKHRVDNIPEGMMVILKEDNVPPMQWPLGRVTKAIPGNDDLVRVVEVRTAKGIFKRPIHRIAPLPIEPAADSNNQEVATSITHEPDQLEQEQVGVSEGIPHQPPIKRRKTGSSTLATLLLTCLLLPITRSHPIMLTPFNTSTGLYFDPQGLVRIISGHWNLVTYYDMQGYKRELTLFEQGIQTLHRLCDASKVQENCIPLIKQLEQGKNEIDQTNRLLTPIRHRYKRAPFDFVGNIASSLFGVLDSDYADKMSQTIDELKDNEGLLASLINNQTLIIDSTLNIIRESKASLHKQFAEYKLSIELLNNNSINISNDLLQQRLTQTFLSLTSQLILISNDARRIQTSLIDVMIDSHHGRINPQLLAPDQLTRALLQVMKHLAPSVRLPANPENVTQIYKLLKVRAIATEKHIMFQLQLPLIMTTEFNLFRIIPIPIFINDTAFTIETSITFLAINLQGYEYYQLSTEELSACSTANDEVYLCDRHHPVYRRGSSIGACEVYVFTSESSKRMCKIKRWQNHPNWFQLHEKNRWIYAFDGETPISVICGNEISQITLKGQGIIKLLKECVIRQDHVTIQTHGAISQSMELSYLPLANITNFFSHDALLRLHSPKLYDLDSKEINLLRKKLQIEEAHSFATNFRSHTIHHYVTGYLGLGLFGVLLITSMVIWYKVKPLLHQVKDKPRAEQQSSAPQFYVSVE